MSASIDTVRVRSQPRHQPRLVDVSEVSAARVREYCHEADRDGLEAHLTRRGGRTFLVVE